MAGTFSDYVENKAVDHVLGVSPWTMPAAVYLTVFTANPNFETGLGGTEATGGGFIRKATPFTVASGGASSNSALRSWTIGVDIAAGSYTGWALYDALSGGNLLMGDAFSSTQTISTAGSLLTFDPSSVNCSLT